MDYQQVFAVSAAGMGVERLRIEVAALNLANAHVAVGPDNPGYQPLRAVIHPGMNGTPVVDFAALMETTVGGPMATVELSGAAMRRVHEPGHPYADARGFVAYPGIDPASEMMAIMGALRAYEANVAAMNAARTLALKTLDIGGTT